MRRRVVITILVAIVVLGGLYAINSRNQSPSGSDAGQYAYAVANPGIGSQAPDFTLSSTTGDTVTLSGLRGQTVLLYFQEGIGCESCWTQLKDIETHMDQFRALGITSVLTVTTNPLDALRQKVRDEDILLPVLADPDFTASQAYNATEYGMMAGSADGHTFILVGPDGQIRWRGDFGGPPNYTMYVPLPVLLADLKGA